MKRFIHNDIPFIQNDIVQFLHNLPIPENKIKNIPS